MEMLKQADTLEFKKAMQILVKSTLRDQDSLLAKKSALLAFARGSLSLNVANARLDHSYV